MQETITPELLELLTAEYKLVIAKQSNESASRRAKVVQMYTYLKKRGDIK